MAKKKATSDEDQQAGKEADALQRTLNQIHKQYGDGAIMPLGAKPGAMFWYLLGLIVALHRLATDPAVEEGAPPQMGRKSAGAGD